MPAKLRQSTRSLKKALRELGQRLRDHRKKLGISSVATAEAAGISRVTLYRIERGEPSVAIGAYVSVLSSLGLSFDLLDRMSGGQNKKQLIRRLPQKIRLSDYPQLKQIAWQLKDSKVLTPEEALQLYERNWRHLDFKKMDDREKELFELLLAAFGRERLLV